MLRAVLLSLFYLLIFYSGLGQDFSNKGKEFWVGYGYHESMNRPNSTQQEMVLYFTSDVNASVTVEIPGKGWVKTYQVGANSVTETDPMPRLGAQDARLTDEGLYNSGIHITSDNPIVAYAHIYNQSVSGATLLFPVSTLGQDYFSLNFTQRSFIANSNSWAYVIAAEDNTDVEIIPSAGTKGHSAGQSFSVTLNKGQVFNLMGVTNGNNGVDLTGTRIRSISSGNTGGCKKIAVFSGSGRASISCDPDNPGQADNLIQQVFPRAAWGRKYLTVPTSNLPNNFFRIAVSDPSTVVTIDGVRATNLVNNFYYEILASTPKSIVSDKPVMVAQYITSNSACSNSFGLKGDPEMIYISPVEQTIDQITLNSTSRFEITSHFINVIIKTSAVNTFTLDGVSKTSSFVTHPQDATYSYAVFEVAKGAHSLKAAEGFNAIAYGYGDTESYGYNAGTNIKNLFQFLTLETKYASVNVPATCRTTPFQFAITLPYQASSISWDFGNNPNLSPSQKVTNNNPSVDSTYKLDGRDVYLYRLAATYQFSAIGTYPVKITANNTSGDGCNGVEEILYNVEVTEPPVFDFSVSHSGCPADSATFISSSNGNGKTLTQWRWEFGDGSTDTGAEVKKGYKTAGTFDVKHTAINNIGCYTQRTKPFAIEPQPTAIFGFKDSACANNVVIFTDSSKIAAGNIVKWYWNFGDGQTKITTSNAPVTNLYASEGSYNVTLQVENKSGCKSQLQTKQIIIRPFPVVNFTMSDVCLPAGMAKFTNLTSINDGSDAGLTYLWNFGDGGSSTDKNPEHLYKISSPVSVTLKATSRYGCSKDSTKVVSNIFAQPKAAFTTSAGLCVSDSILFTDNSSAANSSVSEWLWDFGDGTTSRLQNPNKNYSNAGSYTITFYTRSAKGCYSDTIKKSIAVKEVPIADFTISGSPCEKQAIVITNNSTSNDGKINNWSWNFGDQTSANYTNGNPFPKTYNNQGSYTISLVVETDQGCRSRMAEKVVTVKTLPVTNFLFNEICINDAFAQFTDSSYILGSPGSSLQYAWNFGDANASPANPNTAGTKNAQHKYVTAGTYNVSLTTTLDNGCSSSITKPFIVSSGSPNANFEVLASNSLCSNTNIEIRNTSTIDADRITKIEILWDAQNLPAQIVTVDKPTTGGIYSHTYPPQTATKSYQVKLRAYSGQTCVNEKVDTITVNVTPNVTFTPVPEICAADTPRLITQARETTGVPGTFIFSGDGISSNGVFSPAVAGIGTSLIKYTYTSDKGCIDSAKGDVNVVAAPIINLQSQIFLLEGGSVNLDPTVTGNITDFTWSPATYLDNPNIRNPRSTPKQDITYQLKVNTAGGCSATSSVTLSFLKTPSIPNAFSPNGDGINDVWNIPSLSSYENCIVQVFNRYGQLVLNDVGYKNPWNGTFKGSVLPVGVYYYVIDVKNNIKPFTGSITILR